MLMQMWQVRWSFVKEGVCGGGSGERGVLNRENVYEMVWGYGRVCYIEEIVGKL